jgi:hypothetical protein
MLSSRMRLASYYNLDDILSEQLRFSCRLAMNYAVGLSKAGPMVIVSLPQQKDENLHHVEEDSIDFESKSMKDVPTSSSLANNNEHHTLFKESDQYSDTSLSLIQPLKMIADKREGDVIYRGTKLDLPLWLAQGLLLQ